MGGRAGESGNNHRIVVRTLGDHARQGFAVYARCAPCRRDVDLNLQLAIQKLGESVDLDVLKSRLVCRVCGERCSGMLIGRAGNTQPV